MIHLVYFGDRLKKLRTDNNITQKQLAERVGLAVSAISAYELGNRFPTYDVMVTFSRIFHVSTDYLLGVDTTRRLDLTGLSEDDIELVVRLTNKLKDKNDS